jgi:hypothetical protein
VPDANTIWTFREALTKAGAIRRLFELFDRELRAAGYLAMSGQLVDASIVAAPKQRNTRAERQTLRDGRIPEDWQQKPAKLRQKDRDARWTVKTTKAQPREGETRAGDRSQERMPRPPPHRDGVTAKPRPPNQPISASGSLATFASRTIRPVTSTTQTLPLSNVTSIPA